MLTNKKITGINTRLFAEVDALYETAFPLHEKRDCEAKQSALSNASYSLYAWLDGNQFVGMSGSWNLHGYSYIEHLAVNSELRSKGYGKRILDHILQMQPLTILEIDPLTTDIAHKRLRFYLNLGFLENSYEHYHPSYHEGIEDHGLIVLSYPHLLSDRQYTLFNEDLKSVVMGKLAANRTKQPT